MFQQPGYRTLGTDNPLFFRRRDLAAGEPIAGSRAVKSRKGLVLSALCAAASLVGLTAGAQAQGVTNGGFESGSVAPWFPTGDSQLAVSADARSGSFSGRISGRTQFWNAPNQTVTSEIVSGRSYEFAVWVKLEQPSADPVAITLRIVDGGGERFVRVAQAAVPANEWRRVAGTSAISLFGSASTIQFYVEGPPAGVSYLIDDASITALDGYDWLERANEGIEANRKRDLAITVVDQYGTPRDDATVSIDQRSRDFRFGSALAASELGNPSYRQFFLDHFNMATPENAWKWRQIEFFQGFENYQNADAFRDFCVQNGILIHGHNVLWAVDQFVPDWVRNLTGANLQNAVDDRIESVVGRYEGLVDAWDVNNEMLHGSFFESRLGGGFRASLFNDVAAIETEAPLFVNDYSILTGSRLEDYLIQINDLLDAGAAVHGVGVQGHYNQPVDPFTLRAQLDRIASVGLPIRVTEYDYARTGASDAERAESLETMYRVAFSHPSVEAISLWGYWAGRHWRGADAALVEMDWTVNEVGLRLGELLDEWSTHDSGRPSAGVLEARVFHGEHDVLVTHDGGSAQAEAVAAVPPGEGTVELTVELGVPTCGPLDVAGPAGQLDATDAQVFVDELLAGSDRVEIDGDGSHTAFDLIEALRSSGVGCP
ncbi:MAG: hypothetical protein CMJ31_14660 [Phycisphaerae bacterium]|nr:hypothetical protein [Phycisphaerae bacterium]